MQQQMMQQANLAQQAQNFMNANMVNQGQTNQTNQEPSPTSPATNSAPQGGLCVIFRASGQNEQAGAPIMVQCMPDDKVSSVIDKYRNKSGDKDPTKKFIFNAKNLVTSLSVSEAGITHNANIFVVATKGIKGAY